MSPGWWPSALALTVTLTLTITFIGASPMHCLDPRVIRVVVGDAYIVRERVGGVLDSCDAVLAVLVGLEHLGPVGVEARVGREEAFVDVVVGLVPLL